MTTLSSKKIAALKPREKRYVVTDSHGLTLRVYPTGAFGYAETYSAEVAGGSDFWASVLTFSAKQSSSTYGRSNAVQPASLRLLAIIRPDITGSFDGDLAVTVGDGCFLAQNHQPYTPVSTSKEGFHGVSFVASRSNAVYSKSETVQMASIRLLAIIKA